jgi:hypothetical protein
LSRYQNYQNTGGEKEIVDITKLKLGSKSGICNGHLNLDTRFDGDRGNLLNNIWGTVEVNDSLVHPEFKSVPGVGTWKRKKEMS